MVRIADLKVLKNKRIRFRFSDQQEKTIDFTPFIGKGSLSSSLAEDSYFEQVKLYEDGRGIYWPNEYDFCPDFLYQYQAAGRNADQTAICK